MAESVVLRMFNAAIPPGDDVVPRAESRHVPQRLKPDPGASHCGRYSEALAAPCPKSANSTRPAL